MVDVLKLAANAYIRNWRIVSFFSIPFFLAFLIQILVPTPTYVAMGATFLRTGSMYVDLTTFDLALIVASFLISLLLVSFAVVAINLVIKSQRTFTNIRKEVMDGLEKYVVNVFWLYLSAWALMLIVNLIGYEFELNSWLMPAFGLLISLPLFYAPTAMVIDEYRPVVAMRASLGMIKRQPLMFLTWLIIGIAALTLLDVIFIALAGFIPYARYFVLIANSFFVLPFLIMLQVQIYLTKYTILK